MISQIIIEYIDGITRFLQSETLVFFREELMTVFPRYTCDRSNDLRRSLIFIFIKDQKRTAEKI